MDRYLKPGKDGYAAALKGKLRLGEDQEGVVRLVANG
jgi:hypothetical protein